ncbi:hypothetical protein ACH5RR_032576 [Cinchona calisaya]|uniref:Uncharacterized protein n=1 Tax=Cinchona calisaya TaxID=153742 RepID=A0ABD2YIG7_9GENT
MESSMNIRPRKVKQYSSSTTSSNPFMGRFTRSKSKVHLHQNRSGRAWTDNPSHKSIHHPHLLINSPLKKRERAHLVRLENEASLDLSIKDLRARARRVFSPTTAIVEGENGDYGVGLDFKEENCNGSSKMLANCENVELGIKGSDSDLCFGPGFSMAHKKEEENRESVDPTPKDPGPEIENHEPVKNEDEVDLNKIRSPKKDKIGVDKKTGSISSSGMILNSSSRRKVFKSPSSFSYRRLLPFLMEMAKNDSSTSSIERVDKEFSCKVQNSITVESNLPSVLTDTNTAKIDNIGEHFDDLKSLEKGYIENVQNKLHVEGQELHGHNKKLPQMEEGSFVEEVTKGNGITGVDELIEDCVQTTPPDATIFSDLDIHYARTNGKVNVLKTGNHVFGNPSNVSMCNNQTFMHKKSHQSPTRRNSTISAAKMILSPCSRSKIFKTSSSFSYRRLLPFLMDVAKRSANTCQSPNIQKNLGSNQYSALLTSSDKDVPLNKNEVDKFQEKQKAEGSEPNFPIIDKVHCVDGLPDGISPNLSTPFMSSCSSNGNSNSESFDDISQPDVPNCSQIEMTSLDKHAQNKPRKLEVLLPVADLRVCDGESNCSAEMSIPTINRESFPRESVVEVLQHEQVDIGKNCNAQGQGYPEGKADDIICVSLDQNSSKFGAFSVQGTDNSIKGILKRNPRGCRGLCNCLNCASFRLHAERAFEFSRNQMLDAEEVVLGLINELAELRSMLENPVVDGSDHASIQLNQVREACKKALKSEQEAKQRLIQMTEDMNVHCRITPLKRPRVTFSRNVEQKSILSRDLSVSP